MSLLPRGLFLLCMLLLAQGGRAAAPDALEAVRSLAQSGATQLALNRIEALQPADSADPRWPEWERLRLPLLFDAGRFDDILKRADLWAGRLPAASRAPLHAEAARAALAAGRARDAREQAGLALWSSAGDAARLRELRLLVIRAYAAESRAEEAWRAMLRYEQDYRPLDPGTAGLFADLLLDAGRPGDAIRWLGLLDARGPVLPRLRMQAGLLGAAEASAQARAALARSNDAAWWRLLREAAGRANDGAQVLAALEQLAEAETVAAGGIGDRGAARLHEAFVAHARTAANANQLLAGDDAGWLAFAMRREADAAAEARAYFIYLAKYAGGAALRARAWDLLAASYARAGLAHTALRMAGLEPAEALPAQARQVLGGLAERKGRPGLALAYWRDVPAPEGMPAAIWSLRRSALALRAGRQDLAADMLRPLLAAPDRVANDQLPEWMAVAQQHLAHGAYGAAQTLLERMLPAADPALTRDILAGIARAHAGRDLPEQAADYYLRAALLAPAADDAAAQARFAAGISLARAGLTGDARAQFEWLLKNARDPALIAAARRELGF